MVTPRITLLVLVGLVLGCMTLGVTSQSAPNPPPLWPTEFIARFGLYEFDTPSNTPIFNETSYFYYAIDQIAQLIVYPERCVPIAPKNGDLSECSILFLEAGIYFTQPEAGIDCCLLYPGVGPTPQNFTNGFNWIGRASAPDFYGDVYPTDFYESPDASFKYWTEVMVPPVTFHRDIFFRDGSGAFWAWDHLNSTAVPPSTFNLFSDPTTCSQACPTALGLTDKEADRMEARVSRSGMVQLALHHHELRTGKKAKMARTQHRHHHHASKKLYE